MGHDRPMDGSGDGESPPVRLRNRTFDRGTDEYSRVINFSDAVFAIAMTLLVAGIEVPTGSSESLARQLLDERGQIIAFFVSFAVIGYYWLAHHRMMSLIQRVDPPFIVANLVYLALIAFLPFPTSLIGEDPDVAVAVILYAVVTSLASGMETVLYLSARRSGALRVRVTAAQHRQWIVASLIPVAVFAASIPISLVSPMWAMSSWVLVWPLERFADRLAPHDDE
jgi:uncharacterized membrane protein